MADLSVTAANVLPGANALLEHGTFGAAVTAGQVVYADPTTGRYKLADANSATVAARVPRGIALNGGSDGQPGAIIKSGDLTAGATLIPGVAYYLSATPGGLCPVADLTTGYYPCVIGIAKSASVLAVGIEPSGVAL